MAMGCLFSAPVEAGGIFDKLEIKVDDGDNAFAVNTPIIEVENDGEKWSTIKTSYQSVDMKVNIDVKSGWRIYEAYIGMPSGESGSNNRHRLGGGSGTKKIKKDYSNVFATDKIGGIERISVLGLCNANNFPVTKEQNWFTTISVGIWALVRERGKFFNWQEGGTTVGEGTRSQTASTRIPVRIRCLASPAQIQAPIQLYSVELNVMQQGETCPKKTEVRAFIRYAGPATAQFRFKVDGKLSELHTIKARKLAGKPRPGIPGGGQTYLVERTKTYYLDPGQHRFRIEVRGGKKSDVKMLNISCPPFKVNEAWLNYKVQNTPVCPKNVNEVATFKATRPGQAPFAIKTQGGLVVHSGTVNFKRKGREYVATIKRKVQMSAFESYMSSEITNPSLTSPGATGSAYLKVDCLQLSGGDFLFIDNTGTRCPREGKALINFSINIKKNIHYKLDCSHGNFSGVAQAVPGNNGGFVAPALVKFNIHNTTQANCALKSVVAGQTKIHKVKGHLFKCIKRTTDPVTGDLSGGANPTPGAQTTPDVIADPQYPPVPPAPPVNVVPGIIADPVRTVS
jgi:hypothetical protein